MISKEEFNQFLNRMNSVSYDDRFHIVRCYIFDKKGVMYNPPNIDVFALDHCFKIAFDYYCEKYNAMTVRNRNNQVVKMYC